METTIKHDSSIEFLDSDHLNHENRILREMIKEKDQEIINLRHQLELKTKYQGMLEIEHKQNCPPYGS